MNVIIPWGGDDPHRTAALLWVLDRWADAGYSITIARAGDGPWCKAATLAPAIERALTPIIVADADVWAPDIASAVSAVLAGAPWAIPHAAVYRLSQRSTETVMGQRGTDPELWTRLALAREPYHGLAGGGIVVLRRDVALDCPMDSRFIGWGSEDDSWGKALATLWGDPWRSTQPLLHLWHPPCERLSPVVGNMDSEHRRRRYFAALNDRRAMRALVEEGRAWPHPESN